MRSLPRPPRIRSEDEVPVIRSERRVPRRVCLQAASLGFLACPVLDEASTGTVTVALSLARPDSPMSPLTVPVKVSAPLAGARTVAVRTCPSAGGESVHTTEVGALESPRVAQVAPGELAPTKM